MEGDTGRVRRRDRDRGSSESIIGAEQFLINDDIVVIRAQGISIRIATPDVGAPLHPYLILQERIGAVQIRHQIAIGPNPEEPVRRGAQPQLAGEGDPTSLRIRHQIFGVRVGRVFGDARPQDAVRGAEGAQGQVATRTGEHDLEQPFALTRRRIRDGSQLKQAGITTGELRIQEVINPHAEPHPEFLVGLVRSFGAVFQAAAGSPGTHEIEFLAIFSGQEGHPGNQIMGVIRVRDKRDLGLRWFFGRCPRFQLHIRREGIGLVELGKIAGDQGLIHRHEWIQAQPGRHTEHGGHRHPRSDHGSVMRRGAHGAEHRGNPRDRHAFGPCPEGDARNLVRRPA